MSGRLSTGVRVVMLGAALFPSALAAQDAPPAAPAAEEPQSRCEFLPPTERSERRLELGQWITETLRPNIRCDDGRSIQADMMTTYESSGLTTFVGNVFFQDDQQTLRAYSANYYERMGRLEASGNVELIDLETGTEISGLGLVYNRAGFGADVERIRVFGGRPRALLYPSATPPDSVPVPEMVADTVVVGDSVAVGDSAVVGDSVTIADSAAVGDSTGAPMQSVVVGDSTAVGDSAVAGDSAATADSAAVDAPVPVGDDPVAPGDTPAVDTLAALDAVADTVPKQPYEVFGDEIEIVGNDYFKARGTVQILRDSMDARADSLEYIQTQGRLFLDGNAFVDQPTIDLSAREIMILLPGDVIRDLVARGEGRLLGDRLDLAAPFIRVELDEGELQGLWAAPLFRNGPGELEVPLRSWDPVAEEDSTVYERPIAFSEDVSMTGDSLDVRAPEQQLERVIAIGSARAESSARDSLNTEETPDLIRNDWIEGDTVVAVFIPNPDAPEESTGEEGEPSAFLLDRLEASGNEARSLYRLEPAEDAEPGPMEPTGADSVVVFGVPGSVRADSVGVDAAAGDSVAAAPVTVAIDPETGEPVTDSTPAPPPAPRLAIHYVVADRIIIRMVDGQVETMEVVGLLRGMHQEPIRPGSERTGGGE